MQKDLFQHIAYYSKPFFKWVPPFFREKIIYPYVTYYTKPLTTPRPKVLVLELSNICNLNCKMCTRPKKGAPVGQMEISLAKELIQKAYDCRITQLGFHTMGEPLLYPHLKEVLVFAKNLGFPIAVSANANLLTPEKSDMLIEVGLQGLRVSLEGTGQTYNYIRQRGNFETVVKNIEYLRKNRKDDKTPQISCNYVITKDSVKCIEDFQTNYAEFFDEVCFCPVINQGYIPNTYVKDSSIILYENDRYPCFNLWNNMYVAFNGDVGICCVDYNHKLIVGNVKDDSLLNIWNSEPYKRYRKLHRQGKVNKIKYCRNCTMPILGSGFHMKRAANLIRKEYRDLNIKILNRF